MPEIKRIKAAEMFSIIKEMLEHGQKTWITVTGMSMYPFLRENVDSVLLTSADYQTIKRGDIVLIRRRTGEYILHRVLRKEGKDFYIIGDAQQWIEGPLDQGQIIATVSEVRRKSYRIRCDNCIWSLLAILWLNIIPIRHWFLKSARAFYRMYSYINHIKDFTFKR